MLCSSGTDRQTDRHESENRGHPFRVSGFFSKCSFNLSSRSGPIMIHVLTKSAILTAPVSMLMEVLRLIICLLSVTPLTSHIYRPDTLLSGKFQLIWRYLLVGWINSYWIFCCCRSPIQTDICTPNINISNVRPYLCKKVILATFSSI